MDPEPEAVRGRAELRADLGVGLGVLARERGRRGVDMTLCRSFALRLPSLVPNYNLKFHAVHATLLLPRRSTSWGFVNSCAIRPARPRPLDFAGEGELLLS